MKYYMIIESKNGEFIEGTYYRLEDALKRRDDELYYIKRDKRAGERAFVVEADAYDSGNYSEVLE